MRKLLVVLMLLTVVFAVAVAEAPEENEWIDLWFDTQYAQLLPAGAGASQERQESMPFEGLPIVSLRLTVEGDLYFGRYAQYVRTALKDADTGEDVPLEAVFADLDALGDFLDAYVEENVMEELNTYLDANDLLPVPLNNVYFSQSGVTFHYPAERFQYFSGHAGAVQLQWYELRDFMAVDAPESPLPLAPGGQIEDLLQSCGSLTEPDLVQGGEIYEFEDPGLRGVQAIADENGRVISVRNARFSVNGAEPGMDRDAVEALLGAPDQMTPISADAAAYLRLDAGSQARYPDFTLYYNEAGAAYLLENSL